MNHDDVRTVPDVKFRQVGEGLSQTFACAQCGNHAALIGRRFQIVRKGAMRGMRAWVCAGCKEGAK